MKPIFRIPPLRLHSTRGESVSIEVPEISIQPGHIGLVAIEDDRARMTLIRELAGFPKESSLGWRVDSSATKAVSYSSHEEINVGLIYENSETQFSGLFNSVTSELLLPLSVSGMHTKQQALVLRYQLSVWGLSTKSDATLSDLSDGQRQRLLLSSMTLADNDLLLYDGNLGYIDPVDRLRLLAYLKTLSLGNGRAILFLAAGIDRGTQALFDFLIVANETVKRPIPETMGQMSANPSAFAPSHLPTGSPCVIVEALTWTPPNSKTLLYGGLSFSLLQGETAIVTGPNGSGKSSLGYLLAGVETPLSGSATVISKHRSQAISHMSLPICLAPADPDYILAEECVQDELQRPSWSLLPESAITFLKELLGLTKLQSSSPFDLPWHLRRNVAVLRAIAGAETAVFLDEPTADSSDLAVSRFLEVIQFCASSGLTVICASNDARLVNSNVFRKQVHIPPPCRSELSSDSHTVKQHTLLLDPYELDRMNGVKAWEAVTDDWVANTGEFCLFWSRFVYPTLSAEMFDTQILPSTARLIDLGCGSGLHTRAIRSLLFAKGCQITKTLGIDVVDQFISVAQLHSRNTHQELFLHADLRNIDVLQHIHSFLGSGTDVNIITSFFSLHDLSSLSALAQLLKKLRTPGSIFFGVIVSPEFVEKSKDRNANPLVIPQIADLHQRDWTSYCSFKVSSDSDNELSVPYFHRSTQQYVGMLEANWGRTSVHFQERSNTLGDVGASQSGCRKDGLVFFRSVADCC